MGKNKPEKSSFSFAALYLKYGMFFILLALVVISAVASPAFLTPRNLTNVIKSMSIVALVAFGQTMVLILGKIDLSVGSVMALCGCIACMVVSQTGNLFFGIAAGVLIGGICGIINGFVISYFQIPAFIITLATMQVARGAVLLLTNAVPVSGMGDAFRFIGQGSLFGTLPMPVVIMILAFACCWLLLNRLRFGRHIYACGGNEQAAIASGISVRKTVTLTYFIMGILTATAGIVLMSYINSGQPAGALNYEMDAITAAIVGGTSFTGGLGSVQGTLVGCLIVGVLDNIMNLKSVSSYWQQIVRGLIIALAVIMDIKSKSLVMRKKK
ncbi:ABC transporter permease [Butyricicoccus faecihominis]|uniref:ABC transporter permease n=1 Tax=Butyricicoccaceae TaxID=3085642 RepID=UPI00247AA36B|nr:MULTISPECIES: ABC transporter permease [Butyricicoccaceae]MCQ5129223.1 ABC transporter permease [Butyricicoccus faecihominis]WNX84939.1 ABC transporter permease [Agathobaculum sp. NTUH-O15-33]